MRLLNCYTNLLGVAILALLTGCRNKSRCESAVEFVRLLNKSEYRILDTIKLSSSEIYIVYQDMGALGSTTYNYYRDNKSSAYCLVADSEFTGVELLEKRYKAQ